MDYINFYERDFYVFSNFSSFQIWWKGELYSTSEHVYQAEKFSDPYIRMAIRCGRSAHEAFKLAEQFADRKRSDWDNIKLGVMKAILHEKVRQHSYVRKKLMDSGNLPLIECSWRDSYWGWGPDRQGANHLGKLWMEIRSEIRANSGA